MLYNESTSKKHVGGGGGPPQNRRLKMTKHEKQIIKVLKAMSDNAFDVAKAYEKDTVQYRGNMTASMAYYNAIKLIESKESLQTKAEIFNVDIENI